MSSRDRKQLILDHLAKSTNGIKYVESWSNQSPQEEVFSPPPALPEPAPSPTSPLSFAAERKRQILNHVQQTSESYIDGSSSGKSRQKRILNHVKQSLDE